MKIIQQLSIFIFLLTSLHVLGQPTCASYSSTQPPPPYDACVQAVFDADPFCCTTLWDALCAGAYNPGPCSGPPSCSNGIQDGDETGIDCGGSLCPACVVTAGDCGNAANVCTDLNFTVDPSGFGAVDELAGNSISNPIINPNGTNQGCLLSGELHSTWMIVNIATSGNLEFSFGSSGASTINCYDWIMWPYNVNTCANIVNNAAPPISCNWNGLCESFTGMTANPIGIGGDITNFETPLAVTAGQQYLICFSNFSSAVTNVPLNFFGSAQVSCTVLETKLTDFQANLTSDGQVQFNWITATESQTDYFELQRSQDGLNFEPFLQKDAANFSDSPLRYQAKDQQPYNGFSYYRLKVVANNGDELFSETLAINSQKGEFINIFPNPAQQEFTLQGPLKEQIQVSLYNSIGQLVSEQTLHVQGDLYRFEFGEMPAGNYHVRVQSGQKSFMRRVTIK